jgi:hypothetical protein
MQSPDLGMIVLRVATFSVGVFIIGYTVLSAIRAFVLPRAAQVTLIRGVFGFIGFFFHLRAKRAISYTERDRIMALYAPISLIVAAFTLLTMVLIGYMLLYWALGGGDLDQIMRLSGSSLLTLGNFTDNRTEFVIIEFSEAMLGLILVALLIAYLPTMYAAFTRRETLVGLLEVRAGTPPTPWELISRSNRTGELAQMREFWSDWQVWFAEIEESHTSLPALTYFRSPRPELSWVTAAGVVLDSAALMLSTIDIPFEPRAAFCIRSGFLALRQIASYFQIPFNPNPSADDPISISLLEFEEVCSYLAEQGVPLKADHDQAWRDYAGWRVNYDTVLLALAALTMAPYAPWTSDRSLVPSARRISP